MHDTTIETETRAQAQAPRGLRTASIVAALIALVVVVIGIVSRISDTRSAASWSQARTVPTVHLVAVGASAASDGLTLPGTTAAWNAARLYARVGGYVKAWYRDIGADVPAGTPLGLIETPELDQQIAQARADVASARANAGLAKSTAARWNDLLSTASVSKQEADEKNGDLAVKNAAVQAAQAALGRLLAERDYATVRAPFAGIVTQRNAEIGDLVGPGASTQQPMFAMADVHRIRIYVNVPQAYAGAMKPGLTATLTTPDHPGRNFTAQVVGTSGAIATQSGTLQVQLVADNPDDALKPGGYAQVRFSVPGDAGTVTIPSSALLFRASGTEVALVSPDAHVHLQKIVLGRDLGGTLEVTSGLAAGQRVVDNPPDSLAEGEAVRVGAGPHG